MNSIPRQVLEIERIRMYFLHAYDSDACVTKTQELTHILNQVYISHNTFQGFLQIS